MEEQEHAEGAVVHVAEGWVVTCSCGWSSPPRSTGEDVGRDFDRHRLTSSR